MTDQPVSGDARKKKAEWIVAHVQALTGEGCYLEDIASDVEKELTAAEDKARQETLADFEEGPSLEDIAKMIEEAEDKARREAIEECARWHDQKAETSLAGGAHERSAAHHRAIADAGPAGRRSRSI